MQCFTITTRGTRLSLLFSLLCYAAPTFRIQSNTANQHLSSSSPLHLFRVWFLFLLDYETLRTTGVILAVIMFVSGILIALSKLHRCGKSHAHSKHF
uniref:FXYD domain-containing ion transport regulator n=1 Tax=Maylandia zebra TaxID=106582 RepID=A0A3P9C5R1_9CICH